jgi:hypothetical protein
LRVPAAGVLALVLALAPACEGDKRVLRHDDALIPAEPRRYETLAEVGRDLDCEVRDVGTGGNAGLSAFGVCDVGEDNVDIYLTSQRGLWEHIAEDFPSVIGPNWIVVCPTGPPAARRVHAKLGGRLVIP